MITILKDIASIITAITTICGFVALINKATKGRVLTWLQKPVLEKLDEHGKRLDQLELNDLKQIIMNDNIPLSERVTAGERYVSLGGNGDIHAHYDVLVEEYKNELRGGK